MLETFNDYVQFIMLILVFASMLFLCIYLYNLRVISRRVKNEKEYYKKISRKER